MRVRWNKPGGPDTIIKYLIRFENGKWIDVPNDHPKRADIQADREFEVVASDPPGRGWILADGTDGNKKEEPLDLTVEAPKISPPKRFGLS